MMTVLVILPFWTSYLLASLCVDDDPGGARLINRALMGAVSSTNQCDDLYV